MIHTQIDSLKEQLKDKRLIFSINAGRSGSGSLAKMLSLLPGTDSYHEPEPRFDSILRKAQTDFSLARDFLIHEKIPSIIRKSGNVYIETSHLFCKGFVEPLISLDIIPDIIILSRPAREIAISLHQLETIPGRTKTGLNYCLSPEDPNVLHLGNWDNLDDYQLCYWYSLEIERRQKLYKELFTAKGAVVCQISLNQLILNHGFKGFLDCMKLPQPGILSSLKINNLVNKKINQKTGKKKQIIPENMDEKEKEIKEILERTNYIINPDMNNIIINDS